MEQNNFFIHGNGLNSLLAPTGMPSIDMPGHDTENWDQSKYSMEELVSFYNKVVPKNVTVWGHSLGGHIAINLAIIRSDIKIICFGMVPLNNLGDIGCLMTPYPELMGFQNPERTEEDIKGFLKYSSLGKKDILLRLLESTKKQDPKFNSILFTSGIAKYNWDEQEKAKKLGERFTLILSENEKLYNFELAKELDINILINNYQGHCPWLIDSTWIQTIKNALQTK